MGLPFTIQNEDNKRLEQFKKTLGLSTKIEVLRRALDSLEEKIARERQLARWKKATELVAQESAKVNREFQVHSPLKKIRD